MSYTQERLEIVNAQLLLAKEGLKNIAKDLIDSNSKTLAEELSVYVKAIQELKLLVAFYEKEVEELNAKQND